MKYFIIEEYNEWEGSSHLMCFPYSDEIQVHILGSVMKAVLKLDEECGFNLSLLGLTVEEIQTAQKIIGCSFDNYFEALSVEEEIDIIKLITCFVQIYYDMKEYLKEDTYTYIDTSNEFCKIYKGGIPKNFKKE